ncbi:choice-of-anchor B family protein [Sphingobacteriales bacterium CHB3]|nr:choice-of-anchor B family protein [Sphingobacteriales bacterium CHB3]
MKALWMCAVGFFLFHSLAVAQPASVTLLGTIKPNRGTTGGVSFAGCWGYTAPDGREYAILGTATGTSIIDITNASSPVEVGHITGATSLWKEVKSYSHYAYAVADVNGSQGLQIINLADLPNSISLDTTILSLGGFSILQSHTISIHDGYLYLNGTASGMIIASLANPRRPQYLGRWTTRYVHDSYIRNDTIFAAAINNGRLDIIDGRNKATPSLIASIAYTGGGTHNVWTTKDRRYAITTDEVGSTAKNLKVWDMQNLPTVSTTPVATFTPNPADIVHNVFIRGDYAYVAWYTAGLRVVDIANPTSPADAGGYDTSTQPPGSYNGMWACYPYFPSGKIIGSDMQNGLYIFSFSNLAPRQNTTLLEPADNSTLVGVADVHFKWTRAADLNKDPHYYLVRITGTSLDTTLRASDTTLIYGVEGGIVSGHSYTWNVTTKDEFNTTLSEQTFQFSYSSTPVPIVLASFTATATGNGVVRLNWRTLSEFQNYGFEVQRSQGIPTHFLTLPNSFVPGQGTTNIPHDYVFFDSTATPGLWYYRLKQINLDSTFTFVDPVAVNVLTSVGRNTAAPSYSLNQNYPNPFNPSTKIEFTLKSGGFTTLKVYNLLGQEVATLVNGTLNAGRHSLGLDINNMQLTSGIYFYKLVSGGFSETKKMIVAK